MRNLRSIPRLLLSGAVIVLVLNLIIGGKIMPFGSLSEGIPGPPGPEGPTGPAGPGTFTDETKIIVVDDYSTIQDAINDAPEGSTVYFPRGNYTVSAPITVSKRLNLIGSGMKTQIYQSADEDLFVLSGPYGGMRMQGLCLGSAATSVGKTLLKITDVHYSVFEQIFIIGGYYGVHLRGTLGNQFYNLTTISGGFFGSTSANQCWVYGERYLGKSINHTDFFGVLIQGGAKGFHITDTNNEGGILIHGSLVEGLSQHGIYLSGIKEFFSIEGVHLEAGGSHIEIVNCRNGSIRNCPVFSSGGIQLKRSCNILVEGGITGWVIADEYCSNVTIRGLQIEGGNVNASSANTIVENIAFSSGIWNGPTGFYTPNRSCRNLVDGMLESWSGGAPIGFSTYPNACASAESTIVKFGKYSAKVEVQAGSTVAALRHALDFDRFAKPFIKNYNSSDYKWTLSNGGTSEYYCELAAGGDPGISLEPRAVYLNNNPATKGTIGSLSAGTWGYGQNGLDSLGFNTLYVRTSGSTDPDSEASGYVKGQWKMPQLTVRAWVYKPETNGVNPTIAMRYADDSETIAGPFGVPTDEWTPITATFNISPNSTGVSVMFYSQRSGGSPGELCYFDGIEIVEGTIASPIYDDSRGLMGDFRVGGRMITSSITTFLNGDTTPSVSAGNIFKTANTATTTINTFDGGVAGQEIKVIFGDNNTNVDFTGTGLKGNGGTDWSPVSGDHMTCIFDGINWYCDVSDNT